MDRNTVLKHMNDRKQNSRLEILDTHTGKREVIAEFNVVIEAPNWSKDAQFLIFNSNGHLYRFDLESRTSQMIDTGFADLCNNDHVLSADGSELAISHSNEPDFKSRIYILPRNGGQPRLITVNAPSYLHGWSPDGNELAYCAERNGQYDVYTIDVHGGEERQLTNTAGLDDGPEYDPRGEKIWFNSTRSGLMQLWRMNRDGSHQEQMTDNDMNCWFPHVSPNGQSVVYLTYRTCDLRPDEHLPDKLIQIRMMTSSGHDDRILAEFMGGQGTINVNSWSPDSSRIAFVAYE